MATGREAPCIGSSQHLIRFTATVALVATLALGVAPAAFGDDWARDQAAARAVEQLDPAIRTAIEARSPELPICRLPLRPSTRPTTASRGARRCSVSAQASPACASCSGVSRSCGTMAGFAAPERKGGIRTQTRPDPPATRAVRRASSEELDEIAALFGPALAVYRGSRSDWILDAYLADLVDLASVRARFDVAETYVAVQMGRIVGSIAFYPDVVLEGWSNLPAGWAGFRALVVDPSVRGAGIGRALVETCLRRTREVGAPVLGIHTIALLADAVRLYERVGFVRCPGVRPARSRGLPCRRRRRHERARVPPRSRIAHREVAPPGGYPPGVLRACLLVVMLLVLGLSGCTSSDTRSRHGAASGEVVELTSLATLKTAFAEDAGKPRVLLLLSPT